MKTKLLTIIACITLMLTQYSYGQRFEYDEVRDPTMKASMESLKAHQIMYTMFTHYTNNVETPGFVEQGCYTRRLPNGKIRAIPYFRWRMGPVIATEREYDFTVDSGSRGFFTIQLSNSLVGYTRDGRFDVDSKRRLVLLHGGYPILGTKGFIYIPEDVELTCSAQGMIYGDDDEIDRLKVAVFTDRGRDKLVTINGSVFILDGSEPDLLEGDEHYKIRHKHLEQNNVMKAIVGDVTWLKRAYDGISKVAKINNRSMANAIQLGAP